MKIAVTVTEPSLDGAVDPRFGRCPYFLIVETDDLAFEAVENPNVTLGGGAGIQSAQFMNEKGEIRADRQLRSKCLSDPFGCGGSGNRRLLWRGTGCC